MRVAISASGVDKGEMLPKDFVQVDENGKVLEGAGRPSAETLLHLAIVHAVHAGAVLHTHSVWSTLLSEFHAADGGVAFEGFEMLKGLEGIRSHADREWMPILQNSQDMPELARAVKSALVSHPECHGLLLRSHGLYTWGMDLPQAQLHLEILEFLLEVTGRSLGLRALSSQRSRGKYGSRENTTQ